MEEIKEVKKTKTAKKKVEKTTPPKNQLEVIAKINIYVHGKEVKKGESVKIYESQYNSKYFKMKDGRKEPEKVEEIKRG